MPQLRGHRGPQARRHRGAAHELHRRQIDARVLAEEAADELRDVHHTAHHGALQPGSQNHGATLGGAAELAHAGQEVVLNDLSGVVPYFNMLTMIINVSIFNVLAYMCDQNDYSTIPTLPREK